MHAVCKELLLYNKVGQLVLQVISKRGSRQIGGVKAAVSGSERVLPDPDAGLIAYNRRIVTPLTRAYSLYVALQPLFVCIARVVMGPSDRHFIIRVFLYTKKPFRNQPQNNTAIPGCQMATDVTEYATVLPWYTICM